jgi:RNA polymerase sigma-70 factor, ECF subfamily
MSLVEGMRDIEQLYQAHGPALLAYLRRSFSGYGAAEDLLQETFVQALRGGEELPAKVSPRAWLFGIARHVGLTAARRVRPVERLDEMRLTAPQASPRIMEMRQAIVELPELLREAMELRLRQGLSYEEIAVVLEIPVGTVRSRLHTAMQRLREAMDVEQERR